MLIAENGCAALFVSTVSPDSETAALQCGRRVSIVTDASVRVERVGRAARQGSLSDRIPSSTHAFVFSFGDFIFARKLKPVSPCHA
jgi:hypothetical protein